MLLFLPFLVLKRLSSKELVLKVPKKKPFGVLINNNANITRIEITNIIDRDPPIFMNTKSFQPANCEDSC